MTKSLTILIAEDDAGHFALVRKNLWRTCLNGQILHFSNGRDVLRFLFMHNESTGIKIGQYVLLLDIRMPAIDGMDVLTCIKADKELTKIPIIMLTTASESNEITRCYDAACAFYMVKPPDYDRFMSSIEILGAFLTMPGLQVPVIIPEHIGQCPIPL